MRSFESLIGSICAGLALLLSTSPARPDPAPVTLESLLEQMTDRDAIARWPAPAYVCKQASSHDRRKTNPADAKTWHSNTDHDQFIRIEQNDGRKEWVIMEHEGPGAITRFWLPLHPPRDNQIIRFYFDGASTPAIAVKFNDLLSGRGFVPPPFAFVAWNETDLKNQVAAAPKTLRGVGGDMYLPITFAKSCKITLDQIPFYFIVNYRAYDAGTAVRTFTIADYTAAKAALDRAAQSLLASPDMAINGPAKEATLAPGEELSIDLPAGPGAVRKVQVRIDPKDAPQAVRSTVLQASFDDEPAIWCPLGEFFGCGARLNPVHDWYRHVAKDGTMSAFWIMPYQRSARLGVKNCGKTPVTVKLSAEAGPWQWDDRSMIFHANWRSQSGLKTRPMSDWNYIEIDGQGVYAGDTLSVFSPVGAWYGEGDERVYIDREKFPSHIGTGTEDYYGYAWGMATFFNSPFISAPQRDLDKRSDWRGYTTTSRLRLLDGISFRTALKHDMEIWNWADTEVDYAVGMFWYARPGAKHNRAPQPDEAQRALLQIPAPPPPKKIAGAIECESLAVAAKSDNLLVSTQHGQMLASGQWSGDEQLFIRAQKTGDFVELKIPAPDAKARRVLVYATRSYDYGILKFTVNGQASKEQDTYAPKPAIADPIDLGTFEPKDGAFVVRVEVTGANPASRGSKCYFGLDCIVLAEK